MPGRGVHFALSQDQESSLLSAKGDEEVMAIVEEIEEAWDERSLQETDKAWDAIHRCLSDGTLDFHGGSYPLNKCILGGRQLYEGDDYLVAFITRDEVRDIAAALAPIDENWLRAKYFEIKPSDYVQPISEEDFE